MRRWARPRPRPSARSLPIGRRNVPASCGYRASPRAETPASLDRVGSFNPVRRDQEGARVSTAEKVVLDREDLRRTLVRIAHEIVEKNASEALAIVGIHTRGADPRRAHPHPRGRADRRRASRSATSTSPSTATTSRPARPTPQPVVLSSHLDFDLEGRTVVLVDDVLFTGRTVRAAIDALFDYGRPAARAARGPRRPRAPRASDPRRLRGQEPADVARRAGLRAARGA